MCYLFTSEGERYYFSFQLSPTLKENGLNSVKEILIYVLWKKTELRPPDLWRHEHVTTQLRYFKENKGYISNI